MSSNMSSGQQFTWLGSDYPSYRFVSERSAPFDCRHWSEPDGMEGLIHGYRLGAHMSEEVDRSLTDHVCGHWQWDGAWHQAGHSPKEHALNLVAVCRTNTFDHYPRGGVPPALDGQIKGMTENRRIPMLRVNIRESEGSVAIEGQRNGG